MHAKVSHCHFHYYNFAILSSFHCIQESATHLFSVILSPMVTNAQYLKYLTVILFQLLAYEDSITNISLIAILGKSYYQK